MGRKLLRVTPHFLVRLQQGAYLVTKHPLPDDVEIVGFDSDLASEMFEILLESAEWPDHPEGVQAPFLENVAHITRLDAATEAEIRLRKQGNEP